MTNKQRRVYLRVMRRFAQGKLRSHRSGRLIKSETTARRLAREVSQRQERE